MRIARQQLQLIIVSPVFSQFHHVPAGLVYVDEILTAARLEDVANGQSAELLWLSRCLRVIQRRFGRRVRIRIIDPMTVTGLFTVLRYRIRRFPTVITPDGIAVAQPAVEDIIHHISDQLKLRKERSS